MQIKLLPDALTASSLRETLERSNAACNWISAQAYAHNIFRQYDLHKLTYHAARERFGLAAQMTVRCIAKVADAYKLPNAHSAQRCFRPHAAQPYDDRILRLMSEDRVSLWTLHGRLKIPFACGAKQRALLAFKKGEVDLMFVRKKWLLGLVVEIDEQRPLTPKGVLAVDMGIVNLAYDNMGAVFSGSAVETKRQQAAERRRILQRIGTKAAKRRLKQHSGTQSRYQKWVNHNISATIVAKAHCYGFAIALEDLTHIRTRIKARAADRARLGNWSFGQLRAYIEYKSQRAGVPCSVVDPRNTSRLCPKCQTVSKKNRVSQAVFSCVSCGYTDSADYVGACNIAGRATVTPPLFAPRSSPSVVKSLAL